MQTPGREPSMEDILASIKKVIAEEKELRKDVRSAVAPYDSNEAVEEHVDEEDVLELDQPIPSTSDLGPPLLDEDAAGVSRKSFEQLSTVAATVPLQSQVNPLEEMIREMLKPILKQWIDEHLPQIVDEHVKREISRITGRSL